MAVSTAGCRRPVFTTAFMRRGRGLLHPHPLAAQPASIGRPTPQRRRCAHMPMPRRDCPSASAQGAGPRSTTAAKTWPTSTSSVPVSRARPQGVTSSPMCRCAGGSTRQDGRRRPGVWVSLDRLSARRAGGVHVEFCVAASACLARVYRAAAVAPPVILRSAATKNPADWRRQAGCFASLSMTGASAPVFGCGRRPLWGRGNCG